MTSLRSRLTDAVLVGLVLAVAFGPWIVTALLGGAVGFLIGRMT